MDRVTKEKRSEIMSMIRGKDTSPELTVRKLVYSLGYRYRLHSKNLPGKPDLVFPGRKKVIFVNGCFWHFHKCKNGHLPKSRPEYWIPKLEANKRRDAENFQKLIMKGWKILVLWQCEIKNISALEETIITFLDSCND